MYGGMGISARAQLIAENMSTDGKLGLDAVAQRVLDQKLDVHPVSGRQERIEDLLDSRKTKAPQVKACGASIVPSAPLSSSGLPQDHLKLWIW